MSEMDEAQVLEDAADLLLIHGRCRGRAHDDRGRYCVVGAVMAARGLDVQVGAVSATAGPLIDAGEFFVGFEDPALVPVQAHLGGSVPWLWNDATEDDFEVIDTLRLVAKDLRNAAVES